jgi:hypothetical protein
MRSTAVPSRSPFQSQPASQQRSAGAPTGLAQATLQHPMSAISSSTAPAVIPCTTRPRTRRSKGGIVPRPSTPSPSAPNSRNARKRRRPLARRRHYHRSDGVSARPKLCVAGSRGHFPGRRVSGVDLDRGTAPELAPMSVLILYWPEWQDYRSRSLPPYRTIAALAWV